MVRKNDPDPAAAALAKMRWTKVTKAQRSDHARKMEDGQSSLGE
jgi:hypothetical protein